MQYLRIRHILEMQEDTESFNENSNSEVIILPQSNHLEGTSLSDEEDTDTEPSLSYDAKLNAKLKDLGLYEDGMTIQQKEELLAVVAVSFKTAEEEKTRRRWYEEYANAALAFPDDEIEFSFQQSPETEFSNKKSNEYQSISSVSQNIKAKSFSQGRYSKDTDSANNLAIEEGNTISLHSDVPILNSKTTLPKNNKQKKLYLEKCMSRWKPCMSPKDEPLICSRGQTPAEIDDCYSLPESERNQRMQECYKDFNFAITQLKRCRKMPSAFSRPYHLTKGGHCVKKLSKLDTVDMLIGVPEDRHESATDEGTSNSKSDRKEPFTRTSEGAFHCAQSQREKIDALKCNSTVVNSHTSRAFSQSGSKPLQKMSDVKKVFPEIVIEDELEGNDVLFPDVNGDISLVDHSDRFSSRNSADTVCKTKLPKFSNLRPDLCRNRRTEKEILNCHVSLAYSNVNCTESDTNSTYTKENHIEGDLSDSSSVIDVETIVDDEIEEFVLKRKLLQAPVAGDKQNYTIRSKRLKKNT